MRVSSDGSVPQFDVNLLTVNYHFLNTDDTNRTDKGRVIANYNDSTLYC